MTRRKLYRGNKPLTAIEILSKVSPEIARMMIQLARKEINRKKWFNYNKSK